MLLQAIVDWCIHNRVIVVILAVLLLLLGIHAAGHSRLDVFPEFAPPQVVVQTEAPGLSPTEVEQLVTTPIENEVNGLPQLDVVRSQSIQGLSVVTITFKNGTDIYRARQQVNEKLSQLAGQFPLGVKASKMAPLTSSTGRLLTIGFTSQKLSAQQLRDCVQWDIRPKLLKVRGVAQVTIFGGDVREFQVLIDPDLIAARHLTLTDVVEATRQASGIRGAGFIENLNQRITMRVEAQVFSAAELRQAVITSVEGNPVRLGNVAQVIEGAEPKFGDAQMWHCSTAASTAVVSHISQASGGRAVAATHDADAAPTILRPVYSSSSANRSMKIRRKSPVVWKRSCTTGANP